MVAALEVGPTTAPLLDETIGQNLARTVAAHGGRDAVISRHQRIHWTYDDFAARVESLATGLVAAGLEVGDRVGMWSPNYAEWVVVQYATAEIGVILVNLNPAYRTHELAYALKQSGCRMVIAAPVFKTSNYREHARRGRRAVPRPGAIDLPLGSGDGSSWPQGTPRSTSTLGGRSLGPDDPINIQYTSGTTGYPKGATLVAPQHPEQRPIHVGVADDHRTTTGCASPCPSTTASAW